MFMMAGVDTADVPRVPLVADNTEGVQIFFAHIEVSDPEMGRVMTDMMGSPVPVLPSLAVVGTHDVVVQDHEMPDGTDSHTQQKDGNASHNWNSLRS